MVQIFKVV